MGKIIGESFDPYVAKQIKVRQRKLGATTRDPDVLTYTTSKTSWLRLTSGVNVDETKLSELDRNQDLAGNLLAKSYVLFGGANNVINSPMLKGGFPDSYSNSLFQNASYGFNSKKEYGLTPLPGIESAEIVPKNRGSLREANIVIKAFNREQFNIIETLYMRLKYSILLEWGHTMYFDNKETLITRPTDRVYEEFLKTTPIVTEIASDITGFGGVVPETNPEDIGIDVNANQNKILDLIKNQRKKSNGNYDGFLGWVTNFSWELSPHGVYTINLKAISYGDIIESLSITKPNFLNVSKTETDEPTGSPLETLLSRFKKILSRDENFSLSQKVTISSQDGYPIAYYLNGSDLDINEIQNILNNSSIFYRPNLPKSLLVDKELIAFNVPDEGYLSAIWNKSLGKDTKYYYIKLGSLLRIINHFFSLYDTSQNNAPIVSIDYDYNTTYCTIPQRLISTDPTVCIVPSYLGFTGINGQPNELFTFERFNQVLGKDFIQKLTPSNSFGLPLHIHVNIDFIISQLQKVDTDGDLSIYDFITSILSKINSSFSGIIDLGLSYDEETNTYFIIDNNPPKSLPSEKFDLPSKISIKGVQSNFGSFTKSFSIKSEITNKFATQIAIGAQANNSEPSSDSFAFSKWNKGLTDRIIAKKAYYSSNNPSSNNNGLSPNEIEKAAQFIRTLNRIVYPSTSLSIPIPWFSLDTLNKYKSHVNNYQKVERDIEVQKGNLLSKSFIPISLNLELDGISGIKLFQKYTINDEILPKNYRNNIEFLTKGLRHSIDQSGWTTSIEGLSIPKQK